MLRVDGTWHDVMPAEGALPVDLGDLVARWTNARWASTLHRVEPPVVGGTVVRRRSAAFLHDGDVEAVITALPTCVPEREAPVHPPTTIGGHLRAELAGSRAGRVHTAAARDAARVLSSSR